MSTTSERIKEARLRAGLTQSELAEKIGVKCAAINKYETARVVNLKRDTIADLARVLNVRPSWLMCMDDEKPTETNLSESLSEEERLIIELFRRVPVEDQRKILNMIRAALE